MSHNRFWSHLVYNNNNNKTLFDKLKSSLVNTRKKFSESLFAFFHNVKKIDNSLLNKLEERLLLSDIGVHTTKKILDNLTYRYSVVKYDSENGGCSVYQMLREEMLKILSRIDHPLIIGDKKPFVILVIGVNGVGKTTLIAKLAYLYHVKGKKVLLGAADTFRAAAVEQLQILGAKNDIPVVTSYFATDPASVVFDAMQRANLELMDILIIDTAGRLHNKNHLMDELKKIIRVIKKFDADVPNEVMLVLDSSIGQNSVNQVSLFNQCVGVTGIAVSKLDGSSKGGVLFSVVDQFNIPIRYISFGKDMVDLDVFDAESFVKSIFD